MILHLYRLFRPRLALLNGVTALAGCALFPAHISWMTLLTAFSGVTLLAMGGSALNQLMERDLDALMVRTVQRPLPQRAMTASTALSAGILLVLAGVIPLSIRGSALPPLLGVAALAWYLAVYTPLKQRTSFALPVGALCGAAPPLIGWCLAGGAPTDYRIIALAGLQFIWQIPHFWLLQVRHGDDYRRAGIPLIGTDGTPFNRHALFRLWLIAFITIAMLLPTLNIIARPASFWYGIFLIPSPLLLLMRPHMGVLVYLNFFPLLVTLILLVNH